MSLPATIAPAVLDTILCRLAALFAITANPTAAHDAARQTLAAYDVADEQELGLAADIISFALHALAALGQAADPELSLAKILRLRGSAVSLSRESHKARRKLDQLQRARRAAANRAATESHSEPVAPRRDTAAAETPTQQPGIATAPATETEPPAALPPEAAPAAAATSPNTTATTGNPAARQDGMTWTQSYRKRQTDKRLAKKVLRAQAAEARLAAQQTATQQDAACSAPPGNATQKDATQHHATQAAGA
ncbi:hypothetical protein [Rhodopila sp.]|uniref:hypothetical protein n=1 Tax=Rhodopila sp. TaxID=2480087 RepID=UPI003D14E5B5